jgi:HSF-type DNA-binding
MILDDPQNSEMIEWLPHGLSFYIRRKTEFTKHVLPKYFARFAKYSSFTPKLSCWGFTRVTPGNGAVHREPQRSSLQQCTGTGAKQGTAVNRLCGYLECLRTTGCVDGSSLMTMRLVNSYDLFTLEENH